MIKYKDKEKPKEIGLFGLGQRQKTNLDLGLDVFDGVGGLHLEGDGLASEGLNKDLHAAAESQDEVESALLLDVVIRQYVRPPAASRRRSVSADPEGSPPYP